MIVLGTREIAGEKDVQMLEENMPADPVLSTNSIAPILLMSGVRYPGHLRVR